MNECECPSGMNLINGKCEHSCETNEHLFRGQCKCLPRHGRTNEGIC